MGPIATKFAKWDKPLACYALIGRKGEVCSVGALATIIGGIEMPTEYTDTWDYGVSAKQIVEEAGICSQTVCALNNAGRYLGMEGNKKAVLEYLVALGV